MTKSIEQCVETSYVFYKMLENLGFKPVEMMIVGMFLKEAASSSVTQAVSAGKSQSLMLELEKVMKSGKN